MAVKETMAFIGEAGKACPVLMKKLAQQGFRLLFISNDAVQMEELAHQLGLENLSEEIELVNCAKEGCWEADIIAFVDPKEIGMELVRRIREVATQKIVLCIDTEESPNKAFTKNQRVAMEQRFPHSSVVWVKVNSSDMKAEIHAREEEALDAVAAIFVAPGYKVIKNEVN